MIEARTRIRAPLDQAAEVLRDDPGAVIPGEQQDEREFSTRLATPVGATVVHQEVNLQIGTVTAVSADEMAAPLSWQPVAHERLLPDFDGRLSVRVDPHGDREIVLRGIYEVPLGAVGRFGDSLIGRRVARYSVSDLLGRLAERLDREVDRRMATVSSAPAPYPVELSEHPGPETRIG